MTKWIKYVVLGSLFISALAAADNKTADEWFKEGETQYDLGNFDKAADAFKQAFALETSDAKRPAYLYNVAQAYRQGGKCRDAAFFYKRFLALKDTDTTHPLKPETRAATDKLVTEMEDCAKQQEANAGKPPTNTMNPTDGTTGAPTGNPPTGNPPTGNANTPKPKLVGANDNGEEGGEEGGEGETPPAATAGPKLIAVRLLGGAAKVSAGDLSVPVEGSYALIGGYPIPLNAQARVELGIAAEMTPVGYKNFMTNASGTATFTTLLANAGLRYDVAPKVGLRADLGVGMLVLGGITAMGNPFTDNGAPTTGALVMGALRAGVSIDYDITPSISATAAPFAFTYSPAKSGLRDNMSSITRMDFMVGIGYRM
jgi:hypothetical protein